MIITLERRTADSVRVYFEKANRPEIKQVLPQKAKTIGAFTFAHNNASIRVLEKNGFVEIEEFEEDGVWSKYLQYEC